MQKTCTQCGTDFEVTDNDLKFYDKVSPVIAEQKYQVPPPTHCPKCRNQRRLAWRNERNLYRRNCSLCGKDHVSVYSPDKSYNVLCADCWWSDKWDGLSFGRDIDFSRPFFEQFKELMKIAGLISFFGKNNQNSEYVNQETDDKNCYMNSGGHYNEDCYYCTYSIWGKNNVDCYWVLHSELCYECIHCEKCMDSVGLKDCTSCSNCMFCAECTSCTNCFGCYGLKHKEYHFFNEPIAPEEYKKRIAEIAGSYNRMKLAREKADQHFLKYPHRAARVFHCEHSVGDYLFMLALM